jgi:hypothetical protein
MPVERGGGQEQNALFFGKERALEESLGLGLPLMAILETD